MPLVDKQWAKDPVVIAFFREALVDRGGEAITDLWSLRDIWDDSLVELVVKDIENAAPVVATGRTNRSPLPPAEEPSSILMRGLALLETHYATWAKNPAIAPRLGQAVLTAFPALRGIATARSGPGTQAFYSAITTLELTHDRAMVAVVRPFLTDKTVDEYSSVSANMPGNRTALRVCELAANTICQLLGEPEMFDPYSAATAPRGGPYPEWADWDKKISDLEKRLEVLAKP